MPVMVTKSSFKEHFEKTAPTIPLKKKIRKFFHRRHFLFKRFDEGIQLDEESWYSVIPEEMGRYIAERLWKKKPQGKIIDGFCGSGGLAIQLALKFSEVLCVDLDPKKIENLSHNAKLYNVYPETVQCDFLELKCEYDENAIVLLCPPWYRSFELGAA